SSSATDTKLTDELERGESISPHALLRVPGNRLQRGSAVSSVTLRRGSWASSFRPVTAAFWGVHIAALAGAIAFFSWTGVLLAIGSYFVRMVLVTAAYHRYFSHRSFKTSRAFQFLLALGAQSSAQKGVLWWAGHHRFHHKHSDAEADIHSVRRRGFWHSHVGWRR